MINPKLQQYIETEILPCYKMMPGHTDKHIQQVIDRSFMFAEQRPDVNMNMVYVIAAYHDLGRQIDDATHQIHSAIMLENDDTLKEFFSLDQIRIMAEAVADHRASNPQQPRSIYGKIVSSADRNTSVEDMLTRVYDHKKSRNPELSEGEVIEEARKHLRDKYSTHGYASQKMYFTDPDFENCLKQIEEITEDPERFHQIMVEYNKKRKESK